MAIRLIAPRPLTQPWEDMQVAADQQIDFDLIRPYVPGSRDLQVWINGLRQYAVLDYTEAGPNRVSFLFPMVAGDQVLFRVE